MWIYSVAGSALTLVPWPEEQEPEVRRGRVEALELVDSGPKQ